MAARCARIANRFRNGFALMNDQRPATGPVV